MCLQEFAISGPPQGADLHNVSHTPLMCPLTAEVRRKKTNGPILSSSSHPGIACHPWNFEADLLGNSPVPWSSLTRC